MKSLIASAVLTVGAFLALPAAATSQYWDRHQTDLRWDPYQGVWYYWAAPDWSLFYAAQRHCGGHGPHFPQPLPAPPLGHGCGDVGHHWPLPLAPDCGGGHRAPILPLPPISDCNLGCGTPHACPAY